MTKMISFTNEQILSLAPAAGAQSPITGVSERYSFVPTLTVIDLLRDAGWMPVHAAQSAVRLQERDGFQRHMIRFAKDGLVRENERVDLILYNSHDCGCAFKLFAGVWRMVCSNGLMVGTEYANFSHKHVGFNPDDFLVSAEKIASAAGAIADQVEDMKVIEMTPDERGIYAMSALNLAYDEPEKAPIRPDQLLQERRYDDKGSDLWTTFNVVQENIVRGGLRGQTRDANGRLRRVSTRPVKSLERDIKLNQALWLLTEKMAELKRQS